MGSMKAAFGFFNSLSAQIDDGEVGSPEYDELVAGALVYNVADYALRSGRRDEQAVEFARRHVTHLENLDARQRLLGILADASPDACHFPDRLYADFMVYGIKLHEAAQYDAAIDAYRLILLSQTDDSDVRMKAMHRTAWAYRMARKFPEATTAYNDLQTAATDLYEPRMVLEAFLGRAKIAIDTGDLAGADVLLVDVIERAIAAEQPAMAGKARIDRARVAGLQGNAVVAIQYAYAALPDLDTAASYERALSNIAQGLREIHRTAAAVQVARMVAQRTRDMGHRAEISVLLYHLAIDTEDWLAAEEYRTILAGVTFSHPVSAEYAQAVARHDAARKAWDGALLAAGRMLELARHHNLVEMEGRALDAIASIQAHQVPRVYRNTSTMTLAEIDDVIGPIEADLIARSQREHQQSA